MSTDSPIPAPSKSQVPRILGAVVGAIVMFGLGMLLEAQLDSRTAADVQLAHDQQLKQLSDKAEQAARKADEEKQSLTDTLAKERKDHEKDIQAKDRSMASAANRAAGMRNALEADLSAARGSGDACIARITRISEALNGLFDSVGEVTGIAQDLGRENEQLKADNKSLADKLAGWQKWNSDRMQHVIVTGQKGG